MKRALYFVSSIIVLTTLACGFSFSTASIGEAIMARDEEGSDPTTVFEQDDIFYAVVELENAPDDTALKAVWTAVDADDTDPGLVIDEVETTAGTGSVNFNLTNDQLWPVGDYKVDIYLNDELSQTLEFEVEGEVVAEQEEDPTPTPEPTATPEPEPTATPESSSGDSLGSSSGDSLGGSSGGDSLGSSSGDSLGGSDSDEPEPLPFQDEPYVHPSGAFTFALPEGFEGVDGSDTSVQFGDDLSLMGVNFANSGTALDEDELLELINVRLDAVVGGVDENYEIITEDNQLAESGFIYVAASFSNGEGRADFFFDQRDTIVYEFYFISIIYDEMIPTWDAIIGSYDIDPEAALTVAPDAAPTPLPQPAATATPVPAPAANPYAPPAGVARVFLQNFYGSEYNIDFGDGSGSIAVLPNAQNFFHDVAPGKYNPGLSLPGGGATNVEFEIQANQSYVIIVTEDLGVRWGQVYP